MSRRVPEFPIVFLMSMFAVMPVCLNMFDVCVTIYLFSFFALRTVQLLLRNLCVGLRGGFGKNR